MANGKILLVPGTQATSLRGNGKTVYNAVRVEVGLGDEAIHKRTPKQVGTLLSMRHLSNKLDPIATSQEPGTEVKSGEVLRTPYNKWPPKWIDHWFGYDWRADLRFNANRLLDQLRSLSNSGNDGRWNLIGHSQGGLLIVLASKMANSADEFAGMVRRVALVGCPLAGTMRAVEALLFGREDLGKENREDVMDAARTWPALYQMLPAWPAARDAKGQPRDPAKQFIWPGGWSSARGTPPNDDMLTRARETQALLCQPFSHLVPAVKIITIMGRRQPTPVSVQLQKNGRYVQKYAEEKGDGLVPKEKTNAHIGPSGGSFDTRVTYRGKTIKKHALLCRDASVRRRIKNFFS